MATAFADTLQHEHAAAKSSLPDAVLPATRREQALRRIAALGLPGPRDEGWRHTRLRLLNSARLAPSLAPPDADAAAALLPAALDGVPRIVFIDGRFAPTLSVDASRIAGLRLRRRSEGTTTDQPSPFEAATADERFAWLNDVFAADGLCLEALGQVPGDAMSEAIVEVIFLASSAGDGAAAYARLEVQLAAGARLTLIERHIGGTDGALVNAAVAVSLGRDARLEHLRLHDCAPGSLFLDSLLASAGANAQYRLTQLQLGAASARSALRIGLDGEAATLDLAGLSVTDARRAHDTTIQVTHTARGTRNEQVLRVIAKDRSSTSIASRVDVAATAGGADSQQSLKGLLGGDGAEVNLRPQLEISTDEVKASHGATTGALDTNMLFYLLSRGIDPVTARQLLEWAFLEDVLSRIALPDLRRQVEQATLSHLGNSAAEEASR